MLGKVGSVVSMKRGVFGMHVCCLYEVTLGTAHFIGCSMVLFLRNPRGGNVGTLTEVMVVLVYIVYLSGLIAFQNDADVDDVLGIGITT